MVELPEPPIVAPVPPTPEKSMRELLEEAHPGISDPDQELDDDGDMKFVFDPSKVQEKAVDVAREVTGELEPGEREEIQEDIGKEAAEESAIIVPSEGEPVGAIVGGRAEWAKLGSGPDERGMYTLVLENGSSLSVPAEVFRGDIQKDIARRIEQQVVEDSAAPAEVSDALRRGMSGETGASSDTAEDSTASTNYDYLLDPDHEEEFSVEAAAVRSPEDEGARLARERQRDDKMAWNENIAKDQRGDK